MKRYLLLLLLLIATPVWGATYYITPTGKGAKDGSAWSAASSFATWQDCMNNSSGGCMAVGDIFLIAGDTTYTLGGSNLGDEGFDGTNASAMVIAGVTPEFTSGEWWQYLASGTSRPYFVCDANIIDIDNYWTVMNIRADGTAASVLEFDTGGVVSGSSFYNTSGVAGRFAMDASSGTFMVWDNQAYSLNGFAITLGYGTKAVFNYIEGGDSCMTSTQSHSTLLFNLCVNQTDDGINLIGNNTMVMFNTFENITDKAVVIDQDDVGQFVYNNIISNGDEGFVGEAGKGIGMTFLDYNNYYNNTTDISGQHKGANATAYDPLFPGSGDYAPNQASGVTVSAKSQVTPYATGR